ncbi:cell division protein FtsQ [Bifidobacterium sp. DSM 109958]|uniref:Cell division protein FtsQ n=1 Tax=Bifidobacterium moraviense TaxID=2675323 RepID=A0A7Y0F2K6_9BIFI|nr:FtsQ-type POTRA domain-containing protein [Bifidobacterium sp. DSM 109958]NMN00890.1 cell division protein FtsQ [Bifidobacterium sp. DSM 109958]
MTGRVVSSQQSGDHPGDSPRHDAARHGKAAGRAARSASSGRGAADVEATGRSSRSSRSVSSAVGEVRAAGSGAAAVDRVTVSRPGGFVDARGLKSDREVSERLGMDAQRGPLLRPKVIGFQARDRERRRARRVALLIRGGIAAGVVALITAIVWLLFFSPVLKLQEGRIAVVGANEWVSVEEVAAVAQPQVDRSLLIVSTGDIARQLKALPGVTSASVAKNWPHGITITVAAQKPAAILRAADGSLTAVDSQARILNAVGASVTGIPVIDVDDVTSGLANKAVQQTLEIVASLPESMRQRISKVTAKTQDSITTELDGGNYVIVWGDASQLDLKKAEVDKIINDPAVIGDKHQVNVSSPRKPIIK